MILAKYAIFACTNIWGGVGYMHGLLAACSLLSASCVVDRTAVVYVAPSAHYMLGEVAQAAHSLNDIMGEPVFSVVVANGEGKVADGIVVRGAEWLPCTESACYVGRCVRSASGAVVTLIDRASPVHAAHELLHALGLMHALEPSNIMARAPYAWNMTQHQIDKAVRHED